MKVEFLKKFFEDLEELTIKTARVNLSKVIILLESAESIADIPHVKKLKGHRSAYRISVGDYRPGFFLENNIIVIARFVHRKDIIGFFLKKCLLFCANQARVSDMSSISSHC